MQDQAMNKIDVMEQTINVEQAQEEEDLTKAMEERWEKLEEVEREKERKRKEVFERDEFLEFFNGWLLIVDIVKSINLFHGLIDWLFDWLIVWLIGWLIDWFYDEIGYSASIGFYA